MSDSARIRYRLESPGPNPDSSRYRAVYDVARDGEDPVELMSDWCYTGNAADTELIRVLGTEVTRLRGTLICPGSHGDGEEVARLTLINEAFERDVIQSHSALTREQRLHGEAVAKVQDLIRRVDDLRAERANTTTRAQNAEQALRDSIKAQQRLQDQLRVANENYIEEKKKRVEAERIMGLGASEIAVVRSRAEAADTLLKKRGEELAAQTRTTGTVRAQLVYTERILNGKKEALIEALTKAKDQKDRRIRTQLLLEAAEYERDTLRHEVTMLRGALRSMPPPPTPEILAAVLYTTMSPAAKTAMLALLTNDIEQTVPLIPSDSEEASS